MSQKTAFTLLANSNICADLQNAVAVNLALLPLVNRFIKERVVLAKQPPCTNSPDTSTLVATWVELSHSSLTVTCSSAALSVQLRHQQTSLLKWLIASLSTAEQPDSGHKRTVAARASQELRAKIKQIRSIRVTLATSTRPISAANPNLNPNLISKPHSDSATKRIGFNKNVSSAPQDGARSPLFNDPDLETAVAKLERRIMGFESS